MEYDLNYIALQNKYRQLYNNEPNIFPSEWYNIKEYEIKKNILKECLDKKCLIKESVNYPTFRDIALNKK